MSLAELVGLIKKSYLYLFLGLILVVVITLVYIYLDNPKGEQGFGQLERPGVKAALSSKIKLNSIPTFSGQIPRLNSVYTYQVKTNEQVLAEKLGFSGSPKIDKGIKLWSVGANHLTIDDSTQNFDYSALATVGTRSVNQEQAKEKLDSFIGKLGLIGPEVKTSLIKVTYLGGSFELQEVMDPTNADYYVFYIGATLDSLPIVKSDGLKTLYSAMVSVDGKVQKLSGTSQKLAFGEKSTYPVKHLDTISNEVEKGKARITNITGNITNLKEFNAYYNFVELAYYLSDKKQTYLQPIALLNGYELENRNNQVTGVLEVLKDESYK